MVSGEKRNNEGEHLMEKINTILLDIEGTTTSVSFVKDKLFPYIKENLESYIESHWTEAEFKEDLLALKELAKSDEESKLEGFCPIEDGEKEKESLIKNILWQMSLDRKTTALKQLQGHIWREGYESGKLKGHIFSDVAPALKKWCEENRKIYIFSSGSVEAQKLLFSHSEEGDLTGYIAGYFDTAVGPKNESSSYSNIIKTIGCEKGQIVFLTDVVKEGKAARSAGVESILVTREGNSPLTDDEKHEFTTVSTFNDLITEISAKRKKMADSPKEEDGVGKKSEKEVAANEDSKEETHLNGNDEMEVDVAIDESKSECLESNKNSTEKTISNENKTDDDKKTDSEEVEVDVLNENKKEENVDAGTKKSNGEDPAEISSDNQEKENVEIQISSANTETDDNSATEEGKECNNSEPEVDVLDTLPEGGDAVDPLDITAEKGQDNISAGTAEPGENNASAEAECQETVENNDSTSVSKDPENLNETGEEKTVAEDSNTGESVDVTRKSDSETKETEEIKDKTISSVEESQADKKNPSEAENDISKQDDSEKIVINNEEKEVNGESTLVENAENNGIDEENLAVKKIVSEDKPDPAVEVTA